MRPTAPQPAALVPPFRPFQPTPPVPRVPRVPQVPRVPLVPRVPQMPRVPQAVASPPQDPALVLELGSPQELEPVQALQ